MSIFGILLLLLIAMIVFGGLAGLATICVVAINKQRPGLAAAAAVVALVGILLVVSLVVGYSALKVPGTVSVSAAGPPSVTTSYSYSSGGARAIARGLMSVRVVLLLAIVLVVLTVLWRHDSGKAPVGRWWPVLLVPFVLLFLLGGFHVQTTNKRSEKQVATIIERDVAEQQAAAARQAAEAASRFQQLDIHQLLDKHDAPRIALAPPPEAPPASTPSDDEAASAAGEPEETPDNNEAATTEELSLSEAIEDQPQQRPDAQDAEPGHSHVTAAIEIQFDREKLEDSGPLSFPEINKSLGNRGFWRGLTRHVDPGELRIVVTGELEGTYKSDLADVLLGTSGRLERPILLSDVATITILPNTSSSEPSVAPRPAWLDDPPKRVGNTWREVITAGEYATADECYKVADIYLLLTTYNRLMELVGTPEVVRSRPDVTLHHDQIWGDGRLMYAHGRPVDGRLQRLARAGIGIDFVRRQIATAEYIETNERSLGPMKTLYTRVEFTPAAERELRRRWEAYLRQERFAVVGLGAGSILGLLGLAWGVLKIDTWTKGYYSGWLFLGVPVAIISIAALLAAIAFPLFLRGL